MSHKKAIIASDLPVIREVLNTKNSELVDCEDFRLWVEAIKSLKVKKKEIILQSNHIKILKIILGKREQILSLEINQL